MAEGKGRCDLMPLTDVAEIFEFEDGSVFMGKHRKEIVNCFRSLSICVDEKESREGRYFAAKMAIYYFRCLADLSVPDMMLEVAIHYEEGAKKYGEHNWKRVCLCGVSSTRQRDISLNIWEGERTNGTTELLCGICSALCTQLGTLPYQKAAPKRAFALK